MNVEFKTPDMIACQDEYNKQDPEQRISMSQYDLANLTSIKDIDQWVSFLKDTRVSEKIDEEVEIYTKAQQRKLVALATTNDKSTGTAQMIAALGKTDNQGNNNKSGETFIYSFVPLNTKEADAPYARSLSRDIFEETANELEKASEYDDVNESYDDTNIIDISD